MRDGIKSRCPRQSAFRFNTCDGEKKPQKHQGDGETQHNEDSVTEVPLAILAFQHLDLFLECRHGKEYITWLAA